MSIMRKEEVAVQSSKLIRATWPRVRSEQKHGKSGYVVDARGKSWGGLPEKTGIKLNWQLPAVQVKSGPKRHK